MVKGYSHVVVLGNLTRDPEVRATQTGTSVTSFGIAVNRTYRNANGQDVDEVSFFDCSAWGRAGETIAKWLHRGSAVLLSGRLRQHSWDDEKTGQKRSSVEIVVDDFNFVGGGRDENGGGNYGGGNYGGNSYGSGNFSGGNNAGGSSAKGAGSKKAGVDNLPSDVELENAPEIDLDGVPF